MEAALIVVFTCWTVLTVLNQVDNQRINDAIHRHDPLNLIPKWTFFAPRPGRSDYHLLYREVTPKIGVSGWTEVPIVSRRQLSHGLWNPGRRRAKVVIDSVNSLAHQLERLQASRPDTPEYELSEHLLISIPYLVLLNIVLNASEQAPEADAFRQFVIAERLGGRDDDAITVALCSPLFSCDPDNTVHV
ncbi:hypothetical protein [Mycolicibacterium grossiae]|uniref:hypothetical protein n=1 Tax=Mycolicibacterium grossiae TaxID=1552759 RepID=UPI000F7801EC|nr:hypothetical protein [Mycolicibacterium grossiae]QEM43557.1 hypothetical protein FZ046_01095 [Mycolicibacterium grossiae]